MISGLRAQWSFKLDGWSIVVPEGMATRMVVKPPSDSDLTSMGIARGWLTDDAPCTVVLTTRPRAGSSLRRLTRTLGTSFVQPPGDGQPLDVPGARGARRIDGLMQTEDGVSPDGLERVTIVIAAARRGFVTVTIRVPHTADAADEVEAIAASLTLADD